MDVGHDEHIDSELHSIFVSINTMCSLLDNNERTQSLKPGDIQEILLSICYRVLNICDINDASRLSDTHAVHYTGLIVFMMTTFVTCGLRRLVQFKATKLLLENTFSRQLTGCEDSTILWLSLVASIWASDDAIWIAPTLRATAERLAIKTWDDARAVTSSLPWVATLHDEPGRKAWQRAFSNAKSESIALRP
jgi:hypothetical protein